jgi:hypothetical protein
MKFDGQLQEAPTGRVIIRIAGGNQLLEPGHGTGRQPRGCPGGEPPPDLLAQQLGILLIECPAIDEVLQLPLTAHGEVPFSSITPGTESTLRHEVRQLPISYFAALDTDPSRGPLAQRS